MKRVLVLLCLLSGSLFLFAEDYVSQMIHSQIIYKDRGNTPVIITDERGWVDVGQTDLSDFFRVPSSSTDSIKKWRVVVSYLDENRTGQTTLQIRLRGEGFTTLFTMPWSQINSVPMEEQSNWYIADRMTPQNFQSLCSARLISPPGSNKPGKIYSITLEAWEFIKKEERETYSYEDTLLASSRILKPMGQQENHSINTERLTAEDPYSAIMAEDFSLEFVEASLYGNLPSFYRALDNEIHSLSSGNSYSKFVMNPPEGVSTAWSMEDYKQNYNYQIYTYDEYTALFPEWLEDSREWTPDRRCFLFVGNNVKEGHFPFFKQDDLLVFMVRHEERGWKVIGRPEL